MCSLAIYSLEGSTAHFVQCIMACWYVLCMYGMLPQSYFPSDIHTSVVDPYSPLLGGCYVYIGCNWYLLCKVTISNWMVQVSNWMANLSNWMMHLYNWTVIVPSTTFTRRLITVLARFGTIPTYHENVVYLQSTLFIQ